MRTLITVLALTTSIVSAEAVTYKLTVTNGSAMPLSPSVIYSSLSQKTDREIGEKAPEGFVKLCENGDALSRVREISRSSETYQTTNGMILPGESSVVMIKVKSPSRETIHFETMYGKTRDACGVISISPQDLSHLSHYPRRIKAGRDVPVRSGMYSSPKLPENTDELCREGDAVTCLRSLSAKDPSGKVHFLRPYLSSVLSFLDERFGASETDTLIIPTGGGISFSIQKH